MVKTIDTVKMVRKIRDNHYEETKNMSMEERMKYIREQAKKFESQLKTKV